MPISRSANKSLRVAKRQAAENKVTKLRVKNQVKRASQASLPAVFSILDKAAKHHVIHKNKAARLKSRLAKRLNQAEVTPAAKPVKRAKATPARKKSAKA
jgi:small subunit ribosomal protein S20